MTPVASGGKDHDEFEAILGQCCRERRVFAMVENHDFPLLGFIDGKDPLCPKHATTVPCESRRADQCGQPGCR